MSFGGGFNGPKQVPVFHLTDFGAKVDSDGAGGGTSIHTAFANVFEAMDRYGLQGTDMGSDGSRGVAIQLPPGVMRLSETVRVKHICRILGAGGGGIRASTKILCDRNIGGFIFDSYGTSGDSRRSDGAGIERVCVTSLNNPTGFYFPRWTAGETGITVGTIRAPLMLNYYGYSLRCKAITTGTCGTTPPTIAETWYLPTGDIVDGGVTWEPFEAHGIQVRSTAFVDGCMVDGFPGNGIMFKGSVEADPASDCSFSGSTRNWVRGCIGGHVVIGGDANNMFVANCQVYASRSGGFIDIPSAPNSYIACGVHDGDGPTFVSNVSTFIGCYVEGGQSPGIITAEGNFIGGVPSWSMGSAFSGLFQNLAPTVWSAGLAVGQNQVIEEDGWYYLAFNAGTTGAVKPTFVKTYSVSSHDDAIMDNGIEWLGFSKTTISDGNIQLGTTRYTADTFNMWVKDGSTYFNRGGAANTSTPIAYSFGSRTSKTGGNAGTQGWNMLYGAYSKTWHMQNGGDVNEVAYRHIAPESINYGTGVQYPYNKTMFEVPSGVLIGGIAVGQSPVYNGSGTAAPVAGTWRRGDYIRNSSPAVGSPKGWVCTVAGTPGTWVSEGNL